MVKLLVGGVLVIGSAAMLLWRDDEAERRRAAEAAARAAAQAQLAARFCPAHFTDRLDRADCFRSFGVAPLASADLDRAELSPR